MTTTKVIAFIFSSIFILQMCCGNPERVPTSGPFRAVVISIEDCSTGPSRPYMKNPPIIVQAFVYNSTTSKVNMLSGNFTVFKDTKNVKKRIKSFLWQNGKWESNVLVNNLNCHSMLVHVICVATNIKYDRKNCIYLKGSYSFKNLDLNQMLHYVSSTTEYGLQMWRIEEYVSAGTLFCKEVHVNTEPA